MRTKTNRGFATLLLTVMALAMLLVAYVVSPIFASTSSAAQNIAFSNDSNLGISRNINGVNRYEYTFEETGMTDVLDQKITYDFFAAQSANRWDLNGDGNLTASGSDAGNIHFTPGGSEQNPWAGGKHQSSYYDLVTGEGTTSLNGALTQDKFNHKANGDADISITLGDLANNFSYGFGQHAGWKKGEDWASRWDLTSTLENQDSANSLGYINRGNTYDGLKSGIGEGNVKWNESWDWRRGWAYYYTYIRVPKDIADIVRVSMSSNIWTGEFHKTGPNQSPAESYRQSWIIVMDMEVGNVSTNESGAFNLGAGDITINDYTQYHTNNQCKPGGVNDTTSDYVNNPGIPRVTDELALNGSEWIKIGATVYTGRIQGGNGTSQAPTTIYTNGKTPSWAEWNNEFHWENITLNFRIDKNDLSSVSATGENLTTVSSQGKVLDYTIGSFSNAMYNADLDKKLLIEQEDGSYKEIGTTAEGEPWAIFNVKESGEVGSGKYRYKETGQITIYKNGKYKLVVYDKRDPNNENKYISTEIIEIDGIDVRKPVDPDLEGLVKGGENWIDSTDAPFTFKNFRNIGDRFGNISSGLKEIKLQLYFVTPNGDQQNKGIVPESLDYETLPSVTKRLTDFPSFNANEYGQYLIVVKVSDKAGNVATMEIDIHYENSTKLENNDTVLQIYSNLDSLINNGWINSDKQNENIIFGIHVKTNYYWNPTFRLYTKDFVLETGSNNYTAPDGTEIVLGAGERYYTWSMSIADFVGIEGSLVEDLIISGYTQKPGTNVDNLFKQTVSVDIVKPMHGLGANDVLDIVSGMWYTWKHIDHNTTINGINFYLNTDSENTEYLGKYAYQLKVGENAPISISIKEGKLQIPLAIGENTFTVIVVDQAGNVSEFNYSNILFDNTKYKVNRVNTTDDRDNFVVNFNVYGIDGELIDENLAIDNIIGYNFARGEKVRLVFSYDDTVYELKDVMWSKNNDADNKYEINADANNNYDITIGDLKAGEDIAQVIDLYISIYMYIDIDTNCNNTLLSKDAGAPTQIDYNGNDRNLTITANVNGKTIYFNDGITISINGAKDTIIRNAKEYIIEVEVLDDTRLYKAQKTTFYLEIVPKKVVARVTNIADYLKMFVENGITYLAKPYGYDLSGITIDYKAGLFDIDKDKVDMELTIDGVVIDKATVGDYLLKFVPTSNANKDICNNYTFDILYQNDSAVDLTLRVVPREIEVVFDSDSAGVEKEIANKIYGDRFDYVNLLSRLNIVDEFKSQLGNYTIQGNLRIVDNNGTIVSQFTKVGRYKFSVAEVYISGAVASSENFKLVISDKYYANINKKDASFVYNIAGSVYGDTLPNFNNTLNWRFNGLAKPDDRNDLLKFINFTGMQDENGNVINKSLVDTGIYQLMFETVGNDFGNYNIAIESAGYSFEITRRRVEISLDLSNSFLFVTKKNLGLLQKREDGLVIIKSTNTPAFVKDINSIAFVNQADKAKYVDSLNEHFAFTLTDIPTEPGSYDIIARPNYDDYITTNDGSVKNYIFVPVATKKFVVGENTNNANTIAKFTHENITVEYRSFAGNNSVEEIMLRLLANVEFYEMNADGTEGAPKTIEDKDMLSIYFESLSGDRVDLNTQSIGIYYPRLEYPSDYNTDIVFDYDYIHSTKVTIVKKNITFTFNDSYFNLVGNKYIHEEIYGFYHDTVNGKPIKGSDIFTADFIGNIYGDILLTGETDTNDYYTIGAHGMDFSKIYFANTDGKGKENYEITFPNSEDYQIVINPREVRVNILKEESVISKEYLNKDPFFNDHNNVTIITGLTEDFQIRVSDENFSLTRAEGEEVGTYRFFLRAVLNNPNYVLPVDEDGYVIVDNEFTITKRVVKVDSITYAKSKDFDNLLDVKAGYELGNMIITDDNNKKYDFKSKIVLNAVTNDVNFGDKTLTLTMSLSDTKNLAFGIDNLKVNGAINTNAKIVDGNIVLTDTIKVNKASINFELDEIKGIIEKDYDQTNTLFDYYKSDIINKNIITINEGSKRLLGDIETINLQGLFQHADSGNDIPLTLRCTIITTITNFTDNVEVSVNGDKIVLVQQADNKNKYVCVNTTDYTGNIKPSKIVAEVATIEKTYDTNGKIADSNGVLFDGVAVNIKLVVEGKGTAVDYELDYSKIEFDKADAGVATYSLDVKLKGDITNYENENGIVKVQVQVTIHPKEVTINIVDGSSSSVQKTYDGTTAIDNLTLSPDAYEIVGIFDMDKDDVQVKISSDGNTVNAEFEDKWAGIDKNIIVRDAELAPLNTGNNPEAYNNYVLQTKAIDGLKGTILPRPVSVNTSEILIYNTTYKGQKNLFFDNSGNLTKQRYKVELVGTKPTNVNNATNEDRIYVYMPLNGVDGASGILPEDVKYKFKVNMSLMLDDTILSQAQSIYRQVGTDSVLDIDFRSSDPDKQEEAQKAKASYRYVDETGLFDNAINGRQKLAKGKNADPTYHGFNENVTFINKFVIENDMLTFKDADKVFDTTKDFNPRIAVSLYKPGEKYEFLQEVQAGQLFTVVGGTYDSADAGARKLTLKIEVNISDDSMFMVSSDFNREPIIDTEIKKERIVVNVNNVKGKVYDGTTSAKEGVNFKLEYATISAENIVVLCNGEFSNYNAGTVNLILNNFRFAPTNNNEERNYVIVINKDEEVYSESQRVVIENVEISKKPIYITPNDLELVYGDRLPSIDRLNPGFSVDGANIIDLNNDFIKSIKFNYNNGFAANGLYDSNTKYEIVNGEYVFTLKNSNKGITVTFDNTLLTNYEAVAKFGNVVIKQKIIDILLKDDEVSKEKLQSKYGEKINNVFDLLEFYAKKSITDEGTIVDAEEFRNRIRIVLPMVGDYVGEYDIKLQEVTYGNNNYIYNNIDAFSAKYKIIPKEVTYSGSTNHTFEYADGKSFDKAILNSINLMLFDKQNVRVYMTLGTIDNGGEFISASITDIGSYNDYVIKVVIKRAIDNEWKDDINYLATEANPFYIEHINVEVTRKTVTIDMKGYTGVFNGTAHIFGSEYLNIPKEYENEIEFVILDGKGNIVTGDIVECEKNVGYYRVVAYPKSSNPNIRVKGGWNCNSNLLSAAEKENYPYGYAVVKMTIEKKTLVATHGKQDFEPTDSVEFIENTIKEGIKVDGVKNTNLIVRFSTSDYSKPGIYSYTIELKYTGFDANNYSLTNYRISTETATGQIIILPREISNIEKDDEGNDIFNNVTIKNKDGSVMDINLSRSGILYYYGVPSNIKNPINNVFRANNKFIANTYSMVYASFKEDKYDINSKDLALQKTVQVKVRVNANDTKHSLYLLDNNGVCTKINNVQYVKEGNQTYAIFDTDKLGWFVFADEVANSQNAIMYTIISVVAVLMVAVVVLGVVVLVKKNKKNN